MSGQQPARLRSKRRARSTARLVARGLEASAPASPNKNTSPSRFELGQS